MFPIKHCLMPVPCQRPNFSFSKSRSSYWYLQCNPCAVIQAKALCYQSNCNVKIDHLLRWNKALHAPGLYAVKHLYNNEACGSHGETLTCASFSSAATFSASSLSFFALSASISSSNLVGWLSSSSICNKYSWCHTWTNHPQLHGLYSATQNFIIQDYTARGTWRAWNEQNSTVLKVPLHWLDSLKLVHW